MPEYSFYPQVLPWYHLIKSYIKTQQRKQTFEARRSISEIYVISSWVIAATVSATVTAILGGVHAARPRPMDKWGQPGIGDAEFFPRCIAAGCSPEKIQMRHMRVHLHWRILQQEEKHILLRVEKLQRIRQFSGFQLHARWAIYKLQSTFLSKNDENF